VLLETQSADASTFWLLLCVAFLCKVQASSLHFVSYVCDLYRLQHYLVHSSSSTSVPRSLVLGHLGTDTGSAAAGQVDLTRTATAHAEALRRGRRSLAGEARRRTRVGGRAGSSGSKAGCARGGGVGRGERRTVDGRAGRGLGGGRSGGLGRSRPLGLLSAHEHGAEDGRVDLARALTS
jgi:hypothetical protein